MPKTLAVIIVALCSLTACNKSAAPTASNSPSAAAPKSDAVEQKLLEYSGAGATDCGRLDARAAEPQLSTASSCAMQAAQAKRPFYVAYDMPGMSVGVAGNPDGKLFTVQSQSGGPAPASSSAMTSGACPSQLRVATSGRVTCFAPGDMGSMGGGHSGTNAAPGMANPHPRGTPDPQATAPKAN